MPIFGGGVAVFVGPVGSTPRQQHAARKDEEDQQEGVIVVWAASSELRSPIFEAQTLEG
jgi:hypothetical protein